MSARSEFVCWERFDQANGWTTDNPDSTTTAGPRSRTIKLGKSFQNWRRCQFYRLEKVMNTKAVSKTAKCLDDLLWSEDDMANYLHDVATFGAYKTWWYEERENEET